MRSGECSISKQRQSGCYFRYARRSVVEDELLELRLCSSELKELVDELPEPKLPLSCSRMLAPWELVEIEASCDRPVLTAEESPAPIASTIA
jgi:hypothetical protein